MQSKQFHCERQQKGSWKNESKGVLFSFWQMQENATPSEILMTMKYHFTGTNDLW